jgi:hypothetical protein
MRRPIATPDVLELVHAFDPFPSRVSRIRSKQTGIPSADQQGQWGYRDQEIPR